MTPLTIGFGAPVTESGNAPILAEVIDSTHRTVWSGTISLAVPLSIELDTGPYAVRAFLPNGDVLVSQVDVAVGRSNALYLKPIVRSPAENYGWAFYLHYERPAGMLVPQFGFVDGASPFRKVRIDCRLFRQSSRSRWSRNQTEQFSIDLQPNTLASHLLPPSRSAQWLRIDGMNGNRVIAIPPGATQIVIITDDNMLMSPVVGGYDAATESLLQYMCRGNFAGAKAISHLVTRRSLDAIYRGVTESTLWTVAAFYALMAGDLHDQRALFNSMRWIEDGDRLPDHEVLLGWHDLRSMRLLSIETKQMGAMDHFFRAIDMGLPVFGLSMRLLTEGLAVVRPAATVREQSRIDAALGYLQAATSIQVPDTSTSSFELGGGDDTLAYLEREAAAVPPMAASPRSAARPAPEVARDGRAAAAAPDEALEFDHG